MVKISVCIITKNEEKYLKKCLEALKNYPFEIVVVDTGSADNSMEIARSYTNQVYSFLWIQDFSAARNFSIEKASGEYILVVDTDEIVMPIDMAALEEWIYNHGQDIGRVLCINEFCRKGELFRSQERISRFFRKKDYKYLGRIHEQIVPKAVSNSQEYMEAMKSVKVSSMPITLRHYGYDGTKEERIQKARRNELLLLADLQEFGEDAYTLYQLGKSSYMREDYEQCCEYFSRALEQDLDPELEFVQDMVESYGYALLNTKQVEKAEQVLGNPEVYETFSYSADFCFVMGLIYMNCGNFQRAVVEFEKAASFQTGKMEGVNSYKAYYNIGVIYHCLGKLEAAKENYKKCGTYQLALDRMKEINENTNL